MFFADPVAGFTNIARALTKGARLVQLVWQDSGRQEWVAAIHRAFSGDDSLPSPAAGSGPFSLADPDTVRTVLTAAGFTGITLTDLAEPVRYGTDPDSAVAAVLALRMASDPLGHLDADQAEQVLDRLHETMTAHHTPDGVWFDSRAWLVTCRAG
jgi:hypothetical protein